MLILLAIVAVVVNRVYADKIEAEGTERDIENERMMIKNCALKIASEDSVQTITGTKLQEQMKRYIGAEKVTTKDDKTAKTIEITYVKSGRTYTLKTYTLEILGIEPEKEMMPYIPNGFNEIAGTNLKSGYTIEDSKGNQYVWVEVPQAEEVYPTAGLDITLFTDSEYSKIETDLHTYTNDYRKVGPVDEYYLDVTTGLTKIQYTELKKKMLKSIYQNGGFYVGKYEAGIENGPRMSGSASTMPTEIPVVKPNVYPYTYVTNSQAQTLASNMESGNYTSSLMFGVQWDLILKYFENKGTAKSDLNSNSTAWGNYNNNLWNITNANSKYSIDSGATWKNGIYGSKSSNSSVLLTTGASDTFCKQGIYDLSGNVWEWILEYTSSPAYPCEHRGGACNNDGSVYPSHYRGYDIPASLYYRIGFRVSIF